MTATVNMEKPMTQQERAALFEELYIKSFPAVARHIHKNGGGFEDAKDIFQDALVAYYEKLVANQLPDGHNRAAYLTGIARHLWSHTLRSTQLQHIAEDTADEATAHPSQNKLLAFLGNAGKKCMDMLKAFYYDKMPVEQVADTFGYSGIRSVTVQKYKCLEKLRDTVKEKSLTYADFAE